MCDTCVIFQINSSERKHGITMAKSLSELLSTLRNRLSSPYQSFASCSFTHYGTRHYCQLRQKKSDRLNEEDFLVEIETDKATIGFETPEEGFLAKILVPVGSKEIPIGKLVRIIVDNEIDVAAFKDYKHDDTASTSTVPTSTPPAPAPSTVPPSPAAVSDHVYISPMAKRLFEQRNIRFQSKG